MTKQLTFRKPKYGHFNYYCFECDHWTYERIIGMSNLGTCDVDNEEQDAYDKPCGAFTKKGRNHESR